MNSSGTVTLFALAVILLAPMPAEARQDAASGQNPRQSAAARPDSAALVFEREVFNYPTFARRNPFQPLSAMSASGPDFESLRLNGVTYSEDPALSVASLGVGTPTASGSGSGGFQGYRVRVGQTIGNATVLAIQRMHVVFSVEEFGVREQRTLEVMKPVPAAVESDSIPENAEERPDEDPVSPDSIPIPDEGGSK